MCMCNTLVRLLLNTISVISEYTGINGDYIRYFTKGLMKGTVSATVAIFTIISTFTISFMFCLLICANLYIRYVPSLTNERSLNVGINRDKLSSRLFLENEDKVFKYLCTESLYDTRYNKSHATLASYCGDINTMYIDTLTLSPTHHVLTLHMTDDHYSLFEEINNIGVQLDVVYISNRKTRAKKYDTLMYLDSQKSYLRRIRELWTGHKTHSYTTNQIVLDNSMNELLYINIEIAYRSSITMLDVKTTIHTYFFIYYFILMMPVFLVLVSFFAAFNITCLLTVVLLYVAVKILKLHKLIGEFEEADRPNPDIPAPGANNNFMHNDLD